MLFGLIFGVNLILSVFLAFSIWYHVLFMFSMYGILWWLYKSHIIDVFLVTVSALILAVLGYACYFLISDYWVAATVNRISLFVILTVFRRQWNFLYTVYKSVWDRKPGAKIKSITVRNVSCIVLNLLIYFLNIVIFLCSQALSK